MRRFRHALSLLTAGLVLVFATLAQAAPTVTPLNLSDCNYPNHWASVYLCDLQHQSISLQGDVNGATTRSEFVDLLTQALGHAPASLVSTAALPAGGYTPAAGTISREDAVTLISLAVADMDKAGLDLRILKTAKDSASLSDYAQKPMAFAISRGAIQGNPGFVIDPKGALTRGAAAKLVSLMVPEKLPAGTDKVTILSYNDFHGHLTQDSKQRAGYDLGAERLTTAILGQELKSPNLALLDVGDSFQGTPLSNLVAGESVQEWRQAIGVEAATLGNHEFDWPRDTMQKLMTEGGFPVVSANIFLKGSGERPEWLKPSAIVNAGSYKVGVIGITTLQTATTTLPANVADLDFRDPAPVIDEQAKALRAQGADLVVVMVHGTTSPGKTDPAKVEGDTAIWFQQVNEHIDAVVGGHSHEKVAGYVVNAKGEQIATAQGASYGQALSRIDLYVDKATKQVTKAVPTYLQPSPTLAPAPAVTDILAKWSASVKPLESRELGKIAKPMSSKFENSGEATLGDFIADSMLTAAPGLEIALMNGGGIRAPLDGLADGTVTWGQMYTIQPFGNTMVKVELTGAQVKQSLEEGVNSYVLLLNNQTGGHKPVQVAGITFTWDYAKPFGQRVTEVKLANGQPLDMNATYKVVVNNFMATGGDDFVTLKGTTAKQLDLGMIDLDVTVDYFKALAAKGTVDYSLQNRIQVVNFPVKK